MQHEERVSAAVAVAVGAAALSLLLPNEIAALVFVGVFILALVALFHPALPFFHSQRLPRRIALACVLLGGAALYSDSDPFVLLALRSLGSVALVDALLIRPQGTPSAVASAAAKPKP